MGTHHSNHLIFFLRTKEIRSVGLIFFINSFLFGNWVTRIPDIKAAIGLSEAELGLALLGAPVGALSVMPVAGWINQKLLLGRSIVGGSIVHILAPFILSFSGSFWGLTLGMVYFGLTNSWMDIAMNAGSAITERKVNRPVMSTCHGMWSLGAMVGAAGGSLALYLGISPILHLLGVSVVGLVLMIALSPTVWYLREDISHGSKVFSLPNLRLILLASIAFCILLSEGAIADWGALYMQEEIKSPLVLVGLAYATYSFLMALGRFAGDAIIPKYGKRNVVMAGGLIAAVSLAFTLLIGDPYLALLGFGFTGIGFSCVVPSIFSAAANEPGFSAGAGIASVTIIGYTGFLIGPPVIGLIAESFGLTLAMSLVVVLSLLVTLIAFLIKFK